MTRALFADPHLVRKLATGEAERIRPCVGAALCIDRVYAGRDAVCAHNPATGRETWMPQEVARREGPHGTVVVVGGGPGGLEAARVAAARGHRVVLFEAASELGGQVRVAARASSRHDLTSIVGWLEAEVRRHGVDLRTATPAAAADVLAERPDIVVIATGGSPAVPDVPGGELTASVADVLAGRVRPGARVVVHDVVGRHAGPSVAVHLAERGHRVTLTTPDRMVGRELGGASYPVYLGRLAELGVDIVTDRHLAAVRTGAGGALVVTLRHAYRDATSDTSLDITCDSVVTELGTLPDDDVFHDLIGGSRNGGEADLEALRDRRPQPWWSDVTGDGFVLLRVGDAVASRDIHAALLDARRLLQDC